MVEEKNWLVANKIDERKLAAYKLPIFYSVNYLYFL